MESSEEYLFKTRYSRLLGSLYLICFWSRYDTQQWRLDSTIHRRRMKCAIEQLPVLSEQFTDQEWLDEAWDNGIVQAANSLGEIVTFIPRECPWDVAETLREGFIPVARPQISS